MLLMESWLAEMPYFESLLPTTPSVIEARLGTQLGWPPQNRGAHHRHRRVYQSRCRKYIAGQTVCIEHDERTPLPKTYLKTGDLDRFIALTAARSGRGRKLPCPVMVAVRSRLSCGAPAPGCCHCW